MTSAPRLLKRLTCALLLLAAPASLRAELSVIEDAARDPEWTALFSSLALEKSRHSTFEEHRHFPFRKKPVLLRGEIRMVPGRGLSLSYLDPKPSMLIVDEKGLLMRDARGRNRNAPNDPRAQAAMSATVNVLRFNLAELQKSFELRGERSGDTWTLGFVPRDARLASSLGTLMVRGEKERIQRIEIARSAEQRIEIIIQQTTEDVVFTNEELARYFR